MTHGCFNCWRKELSFVRFLTEKNKEVSFVVVKCICLLLWKRDQETLKESYTRSRTSIYTGVCTEISHSKAVFKKNRNHHKTERWVWSNYIYWNPVVRCAVSEVITYTAIRYFVALEKSLCTVYYVFIPFDFCFVLFIDWVEIFLRWCVMVWLPSSRFFSLYLLPLVSFYWKVLSIFIENKDSTDSYPMSIWLTSIWIELTVPLHLTNLKVVIFFTYIEHWLTKTDHECCLLVVEKQTDGLKKFL